MRSLTSRYKECMMVTDTAGQDQTLSLSPKQVILIQNQLAMVQRKGWGQVSIVVVKGKVVALKTEIHTSLD